MKIFFHKFAAISLVTTLLTVSPVFLSAQQKLFGELTITKNSSEGFVTVNGEPASSGRSISSPSLIQTSPQASAKVTLAKTGVVSISANSKLNLSFTTSSISIDIVSGEATVETLPNTSFNLFAPDGNLTLPVENQANSVKVKVVDNKTTVQTLAGKSQFNGVTMSAGETYPLISSNSTAPDKPSEKDEKSSNNSKGFNPLLIVGLLGAVGAVALIALSGSSGGDDPPTASPNR